MRIIIVDDHVILRDGLANVLDAQPDFQVVGEAGSVAGALEAVRTKSPDIVLMDYSLPDGTGIEATREILRLNPETLVVFLTVHEEDEALFEAIRSGAKGYLLKNISASEMLARLRELSRGEPALSSAHTRRILSEFALLAPARKAEAEGTQPLTGRELEVLRLIAEGATNREIAARLHISSHTVKNHVHNILDKLDVSSRRQAVDEAIRRRLLLHGK